MKTKPVFKTDPYQHLTPLQRKTRVIAIWVAFIGVFVWVAKILFL